MPKNESHLPRWIARSGYHKRDGFLTYQYRKYEEALKWVGQRRTAIDVGAHIGQWSRVMAMDFESVVSFEPVPLYRDAWHANMVDIKNADLLPLALGEREGVAGLEKVTRGSNGDTRISDKAVNGEVTAQMVRLDDLPVCTNVRLDGVDFIKIDCEGYELNVLRGAVETLDRYKPCVIVEQKKGHAQNYGFGETEAVTFLESMGAKLRAVTRGDYILSWDTETT